MKHFSKTHQHQALLTLTFLVAVFTLTAIAAPIRRPSPSPNNESSQDKTLSPYFFVKSDDPEVDKLPLKKTTADVDIAGVIAKVKITQVYKNEGKRPIEAKYVFPASTRAAVHGMKMTIGDRTIVAEIDEREEAKEKYEKAKEEGKTASLLEQQRPNVFQMNVANIMPDDTIRVELVYTEMLVPEDGIYEFVYPTVVGPRYSETPAENAKDTEKWVESPYQHSGEKPTYEFDMDIQIDSGIPLQKIACDSHKVNINYESESMAIVDLSAEDKYGGNRDFILKYKLAGDRISTGTILFEGEDENFFATLVEPPERVSTNMIPPREYIFVFDVSGSMHGFPLDTSKKVMHNLLNSLRPSDYFNIAFFAGGSFTLAEKSLPATTANVKKALQKVNRQSGGGGTRLLQGLKTAYNLPRVEKNISRTVVLATDGYVSVEQKAFDLIKENLGNTNVFAFGIGSSVNRYLIKGVAKCGNGREFVVTDGKEAEAKAATFGEYISAPVLTDINVSFDGLDAHDVEPPSYPDVFAQRPLVITGKYSGDASGSIRITGYTGEGKYDNTVQIKDSGSKTYREPIKYVWVRKRIARLSDYVGKKSMEKNKKEVTSLGLKYSMLTRYTSFVAIDKRVRNEGGEIETVKQPLPMPAGVSDLAVGGRRSPGASRKLMKSSNRLRRARPATEASAEKEVQEIKQRDSKLTQRSSKQITLDSGKTFTVEVVELQISGGGKLTGTQFRNAFVSQANKTPALKKALADAKITGTIELAVSFRKGIVGKLTDLTADKQITSGLRNEIKQLISRIMPVQFSGKVVMTLETQ